MDFRSSLRTHGAGKKWGLYHADLLGIIQLLTIFYILSHFRNSRGGQRSNQLLETSISPCSPISHKSPTVVSDCYNYANFTFQVAFDWVFWCCVCGWFLFSGRRAHPAMHGFYLWLCVQSSLVVGLKGLYVIRDITGIICMTNKHLFYYLSNPTGSCSM